jgi:monovalent cation:H+ antiporter-2, CPA2 family
VAIVMLGKPLAAWSIVLLLGYPTRVALAVAVALAQIGEFSFILVALGRSLEIVPPAMTSVVVATAIVSISLNPLFYRLIDPLEAWASRRPRLGRWLRLSPRPNGTSPASRGEDQADESSRDKGRHQAVVVGYGPVGQTLCRLLRSNEIEPTVIEMNLETVQRLRGEGIAAVYGDASHQETLQSAGIDGAETLILSASGLRNAREIIRLARDVNPDVQVLVRAGYLKETPELEKAGADSVFSGEGEVALAMTESVLRDLGATAEQIDRERERVREDLFGILSTKAQDLPLLSETAEAAPVANVPDDQPAAAVEERAAEDN